MQRSLLEALADYPSLAFCSVVYALERPGRKSIGSPEPAGRSAEATESDHGESANAEQRTYHLRQSYQHEDVIIISKINVTFDEKKLRT